MCLLSILCSCAILAVFIAIIVMVVWQMSRFTIKNLIVYGMTLLCVFGSYIKMAYV